MNKLTLGKKKILGFVTAGAIVVTMAGSYAVWDTLTVTTEQAELQVGKAITLALDGDNLSYDNSTADTAREWNEDNPPVYSSKEVKFKASNIEAGDANIELTPSLVVITDGETAGISESDFTVTVVKGNDASNAAITGKNAFNANDTYKVVVTPNDSKASGAKVGVTLKAELTKADASSPE